MMTDSDKQRLADNLAALQEGAHEAADERSAEPRDGSAQPQGGNSSSPRRPASPLGSARSQSSRPATPDAALAAARAAAAPKSAAASGAVRSRSEDRRAQGEAGAATTSPGQQAAPLSYVSRPTVRRRQQTLVIQTIGYRRTIIPILLTCALILWIFATWMIVRSGTAILDEINPLYPAIMVAGGFILLILAVLNMVQVRRQLDAPDAASPTARSRP